MHISAHNKFIWQPIVFNIPRVTFNGRTFDNIPLLVSLQNPPAKYPTDAKIEQMVMVKNVISLPLTVGFLASLINEIENCG